MPVLPHFNPSIQLQSTFQFTAGTVPGRRHVGSGNLLAGKNNQDSYGVFHSPDFTLATVHDGCSSGPHSEVGALMAPRLMATAFERAFAETASLSQGSPALLLNLATTHMLASLRALAAQLAPDSSSEQFCTILTKYFLFTTIGVLITERLCMVFACGDGIYIFNERVLELGPFPQNAPPYLAYSLVSDKNLPDATLRPLLIADPGDVNSIAICTDGARSLLDAQQELIPGKKVAVGSINQLWTDDRFYNDSQCDLLTPWLRQVNSEVTRIQNTGDKAEIKRHYGLLEDDTTIVALRRRKAL